MNPKFAAVVESLEPSFQRLVGMEPVTISTLPKEMPKSGVYLFSEGDSHLYVGRSRNIKGRIRRHCRPKSTHRMAAFAFRLAREVTGNHEATYVNEGSRAELMKLPKFVAEFNSAKSRIRSMDIRFVDEPEALNQMILEVYAAVSLGTPHNQFDTH